MRPTPHAHGTDSSDTEQQITLIGETPHETVLSLLLLHRCCCSPAPTPARIRPDRRAAGGRRQEGPRDLHQGRMLGLPRLQRPGRRRRTEDRTRADAAGGAGRLPAQRRRDAHAALRRQGPARRATSATSTPTSPRSAQDRRLEESAAAGAIGVPAQRCRGAIYLPGSRS